MAWAWLQLLSLALSFISLNFTAVRYNSEPVQGTRLLWSALSCILTSFYRVFVLSIILVLDLRISCLIILGIFLLKVGLYRCFGDDSSCIPHAFYCLFVPVGHTHATSVRAGYISATSGVPESERSKINQEGLLRRIEKFFASHVLLSSLLLAPYFCLVELYLHAGSPSTVQACTELLLERYFSHCAALALLLCSVLPYLGYYLHARHARAAARAWTEYRDSALTPALHQVDTSTAPGLYSPQLERSASLFEPPSSSTVMTSPTMSRPCSMLYPYLPSAPAPSECGDHDCAPRQSFPGGRKCEDETCVTCAWVKEGPNFYNSVTRRQYKFMTPATCTDTGLVYVVTCGRCR